MKDRLRWTSLGLNIRLRNLVLILKARISQGTFVLGRIEMLNDFVLIVECNQTMVTLPSRNGELDDAMVFNILYQLVKLGLAFCTTAMFTAI